MHHKEEQLCSTTPELVEINFTWTLEKFLFIYHSKLNGHRVESSKFYSEIDKKVQWCLILYPKGYNKDTKDYVSLFLCLLSSNRPGGVFTRFQLAVKNRRNEIVVNRKTTSQTFLEHHEGKGYRRFIPLKQLLDKSKELLCNGDLIVHCSLSYQFRNAEIAVNNRTPLIKTVKHPEPAKNLVQDLQRLYESGRFTDVTFCINGKEFKAHKLLLVSRSPYFAGVFQHDLTERLLDYLEIHDVTPEVFQQVLNFIYTESIQGLEECAEELLIAAVKYQLDSLKTKCEDYLMNTVSSENCIDLLLLADAHHAPRLKQTAMIFIGTRVTELVYSSGWVNLKRSNPHLLIELLESRLTKN